jgi:hypothetical protein
VVSDVLAAHGIPHDHSLIRTEETRAVDVWLGEAAPSSVSR